MNTLLTICTATYNRGELLKNLYESLKKQNKQNFNWIIVDDGSIDKTEKIVETFRNDKFFKIDYIKKDNGGKHSALNLGIKKAETELFFIVDSDDILTEDATEKIEYYWNSIENKDEFVGVAGLIDYNENEIIGNCSDKEYIDATAIDYRFKLGYEGDRAEVLRTDILKENLFPIFEGERFLTEAVVWNRIASKGFKYRWFKKIIIITEYLEGGLSDNYNELLENNFNGTKLYYKELINNKNIGKKIRYVDLSYIYLRLCEKKGCRKECLNELTDNIFLKSFISLIYKLKEIKYKR
ncbi:MAG: glycosyltransferase family 2 protein [Sarcina sp.]